MELQCKQGRKGSDHQHLHMRMIIHLTVPRAVLEEGGPPDTVSMTPFQYQVNPGLDDKLCGQHAHPMLG